jgi:tripartite-type tricarboxylate transporter receptor subunit TctC
LKRIAVLLVWIGCALSSAEAAAQRYPSRPVRVLVGFQAGGGTDLAARAVAQRLTDVTGGSFVVDNRPGASGNIAAELVAKAPADGYTILMANSTIAIPSLFSKLAFDVRKDFSPLSLIALGPSVLVVHPSLPVKDVKGLIAFAKARPKELHYGSGGIGNYTHLAMELFASSAGIDMIHVPYKGGAPSVIALVSGEVHTLFTSIPTVLPQINAGKMRALGVSISRRSAALPNVPTIAEAGLPGYYAASWYGLLFPAGVPAAIVDGLAKDIGAVMSVADVKEKMLAQGFEPVGNSPAEFSSFIREEIPRWDSVVKRAGIRPE